MCCVSSRGVELEGLYPSVRKLVRDIDERITVRDCEEIRGLTAP
jgi:hypothetical protein